MQALEFAYQNRLKPTQSGKKYFHYNVKIITAMQCARMIKLILILQLISGL